jgi:hypothetical protein
MDFEQYRKRGRLLLEAVRLTGSIASQGEHHLHAGEQSLFAQTGDPQNEIQARVGHLRLKTQPTW